MDPILEQHAIMSGGEAAEPPGPAAEQFPMSLGDVSRQVPLILAVGGMVGVGLLFGMRAAGIRFAFGANIGGA